MSLPNRSTANTFNALGKVNSATIPPTNSTGTNNTDWDNPSLAQGVSDVAALGLTAPRFWARFTLASTTGGLSLLNWQALWGNATTTAPILARTGPGVFTITLPTTVSDEYDVSIGTSNNNTVNLLAAIISAEGSTFNQEYKVSALANVITIHSALSGSANDNANTTVTVVAF